MSGKFSISLALVALALSGCSEQRANVSTVASPVEPAEITDVDQAAERTVERAMLNDQTVALADVSRAKQIQKRLGALFEQVLPTLDKTREHVDRHADLPDHSRFPFRSDKQSNSVEINRLLDTAIEMLEISEASDYRQQIRDVQDAIKQSHTKIAESRREKISAPEAKELGRLDKVNPFVLSKEGYDERIEAEQATIAQAQAHLVELKESFSEELNLIGLEIDQEGIESLLSSVSGDDIVSMAIVFDNVKHLTTQLQQLTEKSGEALDTAKRYYGMYVVMIQVMDRIQKKFISNVNEEHIPKLESFADQARENIDQAQKLIRANGGAVETLRANIVSNELTNKTANLYITYLRQNAKLIATENKEAQKNLATAMNTYLTVKLSSDVATLMNTGRKNFETLMRLQVPTLREFGNEAIRREFQRMTTELRSGGG